MMFTTPSCLQARRSRSLMIAMICIVAIVASHQASAQLYYPPLTDTTWETVNRADLGWCDEHLDSLYAYLAANATRGFIVLKAGRIAIEWYPDSLTKANFWYWASAGKALTATLVGVAQHEGLLDIHDASSKYLGAGWTSLTPEQEEKITIWHQLTMTTGIDNIGVDVYCTQPDCLKYKAEPGTRWAYHTAVYTLLDGVIKGATGQTINQYLTAKIKSVTGMDGLFVKSDENNVMYSTPRSMARFGLLALSGFRWDGGEPLLDSAYAHDMVNTSQQLNKSYGYLWWLNGKPSYMIPGPPIVIPGSLSASEPPDAFNGLGKNDQIVSVVPSLGMVVVRMGDDASPNKQEVATVMLEGIWKRLRAVMCSTSGFHENEVEQVTQSFWTALAPQCTVIVYNVMGQIVSQYNTPTEVPADLRSSFMPLTPTSVSYNGKEAVFVLAMQP